MTVACPLLNPSWSSLLPKILLCPLTEQKLIPQGNVGCSGQPTPPHTQLLPPMPISEVPRLTLVKANGSILIYQVLLALEEVSLPPIPTPPLYTFLVPSQN